jgi:hypothetical protein
MLVGWGFVEDTLCEECSIITNALRAMHSGLGGVDLSALWSVAELQRLVAATGARVRAHPVGGCHAN